MGDEAEDEDDDEDPVFEDGFCVIFGPAVGFTSTYTTCDNLASFLYYLGNQLGLTTSMVGEVMYGVGLVGLGSGMGVFMGPFDDIG